MLIQLLAIIAYTVFSAIVLVILKSHKLSVRNLFALVSGGGLGFIAAVLTGLLFANKDGIITSTALVYIYLGLLALGLIGGSFLGLKFIGVKYHGT